MPLSVSPLRAGLSDGAGRCAHRCQETKRQRSCVRRQTDWLDGGRLSGQRGRWAGLGLGPHPAAAAPLQLRGGPATGAGRLPGCVCSDDQCPLSAAAAPPVWPCVSVRRMRPNQSRVSVLLQMECFPISGVHLSPMARSAATCETRPLLRRWRDPLTAACRPYARPTGARRPPAPMHRLFLTHRAGRAEAGRARAGAGRGGWRSACAPGSHSTRRRQGTDKQRQRHLHASRRTTSSYRWKQTATRKQTLQKVVKHAHL